MGSSNANLRPVKFCGESCDNDWRQCGHQYQQQRPEATLGECLRLASELHSQPGRDADTSHSRTNCIWCGLALVLLSRHGFHPLSRAAMGQSRCNQIPTFRGGSTLVDKQGIILFEVSGWSNATGHATLFNGRTCYDQCYFNEPGANYRTDRAHFWSLP